LGIRSGGVRTILHGKVKRGSKHTTKGGGKKKICGGRRLNRELKSELKDPSPPTKYRNHARRAGRNTR